ncbi:hypothetical protein BH09PLA1_BH09PLA1_03610 [soil metagenome]
MDSVTVTANEPLPLETRAGVTSSFPSAIVCAIAFRVLIFSLGVLSVYTAAGKLNTINATGHPWVAWDGDHYLTLTNLGYAPSMDHERFSLIAFFPALPLVARPLTAFMHAATALVLIANVCALIGFVFLYSWAKQIAGQRIAMLCVLIMSTYPGAVFFSAGLTEGPFFMLVAMALWMLQREKYWGAAIVAAVATATRPTGVALALLVPLHYFIYHPQLPFVKRAAMFLVLGFVSALGGMSYQAFIWQRYKAPDAYFQAQHEWEVGDKEKILHEASEGVHRYSLRFFLERAGRPQGWNRVMGLMLVVIIVVGLFKPDPIPRVFFLVPLLIFLMTYLPNNGLRASSIIRYETAGIPIFLLAAVWLAQLERRAVVLVILGTQLLIQCYYAVQFSRGYWVG